MRAEHDAQLSRSGARPVNVRTRPATIVFVAASDAQVHAALMRAWDRIQHEDSRVPPVVIDLSPGRPSSCTSVGWNDDPKIIEINLKPHGPAGQTMTAAEALEFLLHHAAHSITGPTTASEGRYHSPGYRDAAMALGLGAARTATGYGATELASGTRTRYRRELAALDRALARWEPTEQVKALRKSRNPELAVCSCGRKVRVRRPVYDIAPITCGRCGQPFLIVP